MGIKYGRTRLLDQGRAARLVKPPVQPPKMRMGTRQRLLVIYSGILLFCAFALIGEMYLKLERPGAPALLIRGVALVDAIETHGEGRTAALRLEFDNGSAHIVTVPLDATHASLRPGQHVGVLARWEQGTPRVVEVSPAPLPDSGP